MSDVEARLQRLEDIEAIKQLKALYCAHCDNNYEPDGIAACYTEDAVWDGSPEFPRLEGARRDQGVLRRRHRRDVVRPSSGDEPDDRGRRR